jgi:hypothetical protein
LKRLAPWLVVVVLTAVYLGWAFFPASAPYTGLLTQHRLLALAALVKLALLLAGALLAFACRDRLEPENPARPAWALLSAGLFATLVGQLSLAPYQLVLGTTPFPSVGDLYYVLSYPLFFAAFLSFLRAYHQAGLPVGSVAERVGVAAGTAVATGTVALVVLRPLAAAGGTTLERTLNLAYPVLDLLLLLPLALLLRIALRLRGSHVGDVWVLLLAGFVFLCCGDVFFAYFTALGHAGADPYVHLTYMLAYGLVASGADRQLRLLRD